MRKLVQNKSVNLDSKIKKFLKKETFTTGTCHVGTEKLDLLSHTFCSKTKY